MSKRHSPAASLRAERKRYLEMCGTKGGSAAGFRDWIRDRSSEDARLFPLDAMRDEAATKVWNEQPRDQGPDLFTLEGDAVPEFLTRPSRDAASGEDDAGFEKVDQKFATINDLFEDALIKMRKAAQASAASERRMQQADEARRRAGGDMSAFLRDIADKK